MAADALADALAAAPAAAAAASPGAKQGYQGFGSFHSEDVELLVRLPASSYEPPPLPFDDAEGDAARAADDGGASAASSSSRGSSSSGFGLQMRQQFLIDFGAWTFVNHGAFGGTSRAAYVHAERWRRHCEAQPLRFIDRQLFPHLVRVIRELSAFVNCPPQDLVLLPNATTGLNAVIRSVSLQPGDALYSLDIGYGSVKKMLQAACDASGADMVVAQVQLPVSAPSDILRLVASTLPAHAKLAVFDAVTSNTALVLPLQQLVALCRERGVPVLVDGAHALGMLPIDLQRLAPDFFVSNGHKWLCGVRGSALLYAAPRWQAQLQPPVLSHGAQAGFLSRFIWDGCRDYAPLLALSAAVRWWRGLGDAPAAADGGSEPGGACCDPTQPAHAGDGGTAARAYMFSLLREAAQLLAGMWGTRCFAPPAMTGAMTLVALPAGGEIAAPGGATSADAKHVQDLLHECFSCEVPVKCVGACLYVRISTHVYNVLGDYEALGRAVLQLQQQQQGEAAGPSCGGSGGS